MKTLLSILLLALAAMTLSQEMREPENVITVTGSGQVFASPDEATVRLGVQQQATTAQEAQSRANAVIQKLLAALTKLGIEKEKIQTSRMSLSPVYDQPRPGETMKIGAYQAQDQLSVRLTDFSLIGKVIDAGTFAGVNTVDGVDFQLRNARGPRAQSYKDAVADARAKADAIASALGVQITGVYDVHADSANPVVPRAMSMMKADFAASTPVEPGQMEVSVSVTIRYRYH